MNKVYIALIIAVLLIVAGAVWYTREPDLAPSEEQNTELSSLAVYPYACEGGVEFAMTVAGDMLSILIEPIQGASYPARSTLVDSPTDTGRRYRSAEYEFHGKGETVTLYDVATQKSYTCNPLPNPDEAPFNFGD